MVIAWYAPPAWGMAATMMGAMGASLTLSGVVGLLTKPPSMSDYSKEGEKNKAPRLATSKT